MTALVDRRPVWPLNLLVGLGALVYASWGSWHHWPPGWWWAFLAFAVGGTNLVAAGVLWERDANRQAIRDLAAAIQADVEGEQ